MAHPFQQLQSEYESWVEHCVPNPDRLAEIDHVAKRLTQPAALARLKTISDQTGIPIVVMATIGERECGFDFTKNWAQGDSLNRPSVNVPAGRPPLGTPPNDHFPVTWEYAALDAFTVCDRLNVLSVPEWTLPYACFKWEGYNGFGSRGQGIRTPYVVGGTNLQQRGKYIRDHVWDSSVMDGQLGCLPIAMRMIELVPSLAFGPAIGKPIAAPSIIPVQAPVGIGGGLTGTKWIQSAANLILKLDPPLLVDGDFGRYTRDAVRQMQSQFGLPQTGIVDNFLCTAIDTRLALMKPKTS